MPFQEWDILWNAGVSPVLGQLQKTNCIEITVQGSCVCPSIGRLVLPSLSAQDQLGCLRSINFY